MALPVVPPQGSAVGKRFLAGLAPTSTLAAVVDVATSVRLVVTIHHRLNRGRVVAQGAFQFPLIHAVCGVVMPLTVSRVSAVRDTALGASCGAAGKEIKMK